MAAKRAARIFVADAKPALLSRTALGPCSRESVHARRGSGAASFTIVLRRPRVVVARLSAEHTRWKKRGGRLGDGAEAVAQGVVECPPKHEVCHPGDRDDDEDRGKNERDEQLFTQRSPAGRKTHGRDVTGNRPVS